MTYLQTSAAAVIGLLKPFDFFQRRFFFFYLQPEQRYCLIQWRESPCIYEKKEERKKRSIPVARAALQRHVETM